MDPLGVGVGGEWAQGFWDAARIPDGRSLVWPFVQWVKGDAYTGKVRGHSLQPPSLAEQSKTNHSPNQRS